MLAETFGQFFAPAALTEIIAANLWQDSPFTLLGHPHIHFDNSQFASALDYIEQQHTLVIRSSNPHDMRAAFGRLTHGAQDFYAHSNYVDLWLAANGGLAATIPADIDGLDPAILNHPDLRSGTFYWWRDLIYYVPGLSGFARKYLLFAGSHEQMNLDDESRGPKFAYALCAAKQRTLAEYRRAVHTLTPERAALFHGQPRPTARPRLAPLN
jgi:hypothetical protein